jgi:hypothetical protein
MCTVAFRLAGEQGLQNFLSMSVAGEMPLAWVKVQATVWYTFSNVVDLAALSDEVVGVVRETMHPEHASMWLRPDLARRGREGPE